MCMMIYDVFSKFWSFVIIIVVMLLDWIFGFKLIGNDCECYVIESK